MHDLIGQTLGQYRIVEQLGKGGMATVYKAFQPSLERYVAIKVLPPYFAHEEGFSERFVREAKAIARLDHPHILPIHDYGQEGEISYIVMKYVDAGTLKELESEELLSLAQVADILSQTAEALDYAHRQGVIHRDIKPANILMDRGTWVLLSDFGLARIVEGSQQLTASGVGVGTPAYMAPEQGQGKRVDCRADIYSLGIVLYEMLTGRVPYEAETPLAVVLKHVTEPLTMPRLVNPEIPEAVELVVLKALAKDPDDRYQSAGEMATALQCVVQDARLPSETAVPWTAHPEPIASEATADRAVPLPDLTAPDVPAQEVASELGRATVAAEEWPTPCEPVVSAPAPAQVPRRRVPWWAYAIGGVLIVALVVTGVLFAPGWLSRNPEATAAVVVAWPTSTPLLTPTVGQEPKAVPPVLGQGVVLAVFVGQGRDVEALSGEMASFLSAHMDRPVEVIAVDDPLAWPDVLSDGRVDAVLLRTADYVWLRDDVHIPLEVLLYAHSIFSGQLIVRDDGTINEPAELKGRPVALISWNDQGGILERAALAERGIHVDKECQTVYLAPDYSREASEEALRLLARGEVDAAIVHSLALGMVAEAAPELGERLRVLDESKPMSFGVLAIRPGMPQEVVEALRTALVEVNPDLLRALTPFGELVDTDEPLAEHFARALEAIGLEAWRLVENTPPPALQPREEAGPPAPTGLRVAMVLEAGVDVEHSIYALPVSVALQRSMEEFGLEVAFRETPGGGVPAEMTLRAIEEGYNVIVATGWADPESLWGVARDHPRTTFLSLGWPYSQPLPNLLSYSYRMSDAGFLAGALAGRASERGQVAVVAGKHIPTVEQLVAGFEKGAALSCPDCKLRVEFAESCWDMDLGRELGHTMVAEGADVVFNAAGPLGSAAIRAAAQDGAWVIGVDWDEYRTTFEEGRVPEAERLLGSLVVRTDRQTHEAISSLVQGDWQPGNVVLGIAEDGIEFVPAPKVAHPHRAGLDAYVKELTADLGAGETRP